MEEIADLTETPEWADLVQAENAFSRARMRFLNVANRGGVLQAALAKTSQRGTALRVLLMLDEREVRPLLPDLIEVASFVQGEASLVRQIFGRFDREWLYAELPPYLEQILERAPDHRYRRLAELLSVLDARDLLRALVARAEVSSDEHVRKVASDFGPIAEGRETFDVNFYPIDGS